VIAGRFRVSPDDFQVAEQLAFEPGGGGEHLYVKLRKTGCNTAWVGSQLARRLGLRPRAVGYAGLKDRHAMTEQWFSLHLPGVADPELPELPGVEYLECCRHRAKLRVGALGGNRFLLVLRDCYGNFSALDRRLQQIGDDGVPNYFGPQRFGHGGANLDLLEQPGALRDRRRRSFGLSALRSAMFNGYLAERVRQDSWRQRLEGERSKRDDTGTGTGLLWGRGENLSAGAARVAEDAWYGQFDACRGLLEAQGMDLQRRRLRVRPLALQWQRDDDRITLEFTLPKGAYATAVLRELGELGDAAAEEG
jgi:tRNA pseudouridine13 synthase